MSWRQEQSADRFFRLAKEEGYRARSAYKLVEIANKNRLLRPGDVVLDLGAAPGSWSQVAYERVGQAGRVIAVDLQPIETLPGVQSIVGDIRDKETQKQIREALHGKADVVLSDIAPSSTGIAVTDQARAIELATMALNTA
ncbi:MAG TPA: RlmE family RNA methyltransferase, partial [Chloroflexota bacterium]|nr:RlmE family RNA methyltransferase [Chloroflexota bacterium]